MTSKYQTDDLEFIDSLSSQYKIITRHYDMEQVQSGQLNCFTPDHTHYCLDCRDWYPSKESAFECKIEHATVTHNEHVIYCV
jgi:hypothetical protein